MHHCEQKWCVSVRWNMKGFYTDTLVYLRDSMNPLEPYGSYDRKKCLLKKLMITKIELQLEKYILICFKFKGI